MIIDDHLLIQIWCLFLQGFVGINDNHPIR